MVMTFVEAYQARRDGGNVLYFGSSISIRSQLSRASVGGESLGKFFYTSCHKGFFDGQSLPTGQLPRLTCVYSPVDPIGLVNTTNPSWVAIDCDSVVQLPWLRDLLDYLSNRQIATVAWSSNPLSQVRRDFIGAGAESFIWPLRVLCDERARGTVSNNEVGAILRGDICSRDIVPCQITGVEADSFSAFLRAADHELARGMNDQDGRLSRDALQVAYRLLRTLERLCVPLAHYEVEADHYWGIHSIAHLRSGLDRFIKAVGDLPVANFLEAARRQIEEITDWLGEHQPPLWGALIDLCIEDTPSDIDRLFVFGGQSHAQMFLNAMATQERVSQNTLAEMRIFPVSVSQLVRRLTDRQKHSESNVDSTGIIDFLPSGDRPCLATVVGIPSEYVCRTLGPLLAIEHLEILHYPHQVSRLDRLVAHLDAALDTPHDVWMATLRSLAGESRTEPVQRQRRTHFQLAAVRNIQGRPLPTSSFRGFSPLWESGTRDDAIHYLFASDAGGEFADDGAISLIGTDDSRNEERDSTPVTVAKAIQIDFLGGWRGTFAPQQRLNFISADGILSSRTAASAHTGDRVLYIFGNRQQTLYELIVSRIHDEPEIQVHLNFIQRWQEEVQRQFRIWIQKGHTVDELFREMRRRGSSLRTSLAIRLWCEGLTLRPRDQEDLLRVAEILDMPFTRQCHEQVHRAGDRIHGLHIQVSLRLRYWLQHGAMETDMRNDVIDERTGLTFGDIQDALLPLKVRRLEEVDGPFDFMSLGQIERTDSHA